MMSFLLRSIRGLVLVSLLAGPLSGCMEKERLICAPSEIGRIEGFVLGGGRPVVHRDVKALPAENAESGYFEATSDSTGWYSIIVPAGRYALTVAAMGGDLYYRSGGVCRERSEADSVTVKNGSARADLLAGSIELNVGVPEDFSPGDYTFTAYLCEGGEVDDVGLARAPAGSTTVQFPFLPPGTCVLSCEQRLSGEFWLPPTNDLARAERIDVAVNQPSVRSFTLPQPAELSVTVTGASQTLALRSSVTIVTPDSLSVEYLHMNDQGIASYLAYAPISLRICAQIDDVRRWVGGWTHAEATTFELSPGDPPLRIEFRDSAIVCTLEDPAMSAYFWARYYIYDEHGRLLADCVPQRERPAPLPNLVPGAYLLKVVPTRFDQTWCEQWFDDADSAAAATPIVIAGETSVVPITMHLHKGGTISGQVLKSDGSPLDDEVWIFKDRVPDPTLYPHGKSVHTDPATGSFQVIGLTDGDYYLGVVTTYRELCWYPGTRDRAAAVPVHVVGHGDVRGINWRKQ